MEEEGRVVGDKMYTSKGDGSGDRQKKRSEEVLEEDGDVEEARENVCGGGASILREWKVVVTKPDWDQGWAGIRPSNKLNKKDVICLATKNGRATYRPS